ncbi:MAG: hypothetical protein Q8R09_03590 [Anaerolineaceae bacterium]|jgi:multidrug efflux pump subunit AcrB|nr:hypothetical protein [Anaerolineaceae bacterium]
MFSLLFLVFVIAAVIIILALAVAGAIIFRKKPINPNPQIDPDNVIDVTSSDVN